MSVSTIAWLFSIIGWEKLDNLHWAGSRWFAERSASEKKLGYWHARLDRHLLSTTTQLASRVGASVLSAPRIRKTARFYCVARSFRPLTPGISRPCRPRPGLHSRWRHLPGESLAAACCPVGVIGLGTVSASDCRFTRAFLGLPGLR